MHHEVPNTQTVEANPNQHFSAQMSELEAKANELAKQGLSTSAIEHEMQALEHNYHALQSEAIPNTGEIESELEILGEASQEQSIPHNEVLLVQDNLEQMQSVSKTEASEYDNFKTNISDKSSLLWNKLKECTSESFWKTAYGIYKAPQSIAYSTEAVKQTKEFTIEKMSTMRNATSEAVGAVASAAEAKTMEMVQKSKDGIESGKRAIREAGMAVKSHAELGVSTACETLKNSKNVIKQKLIIAQIGYFESQGKRISAEAASAFAKANRIRASLSALEA